MTYNPQNSKSKQDYCNKRPKPPYKHPEETEPSISEIEDMMMDLIDTRATDGCVVEPDGWCEHGHVSWLIYKGFM